MHSVSHTEQYLIKICLISVEPAFEEELAGHTRNICNTLVVCTIEIYVQCSICNNKIIAYSTRLTFENDYEYAKRC